MAWYGKSTSDARVWMTINSSVARGISHTKLSVLFEVSTPMWVINLRGFLEDSEFMGKIFTRDKRAPSRTIIPQSFKFRLIFNPDFKKRKKS